MRKILYICLMLIFTLNIETSAQILGDKNWSTTPLFIDDFNVPGRYWKNDWTDYSAIKWRAYSRFGGVFKPRECQVYQKENCVFNDTDQTMELWANYVGGPMICGDYAVPTGFWCTSSHPALYYYSGYIDVCDSLNPGVQDFLYGYFEIRCKLPVHRGAFPAFWLWGGGTYYEEIDIFEYSWLFTEYDWNSNTPGFGSSRCFTTGIYLDEIDMDSVPSFAREYPVISPSEPDLAEWNTFACEWSPGRVIWYFNGEIVNEHYGEGVPYRPMTLKANYALDSEVLDEDSLPRTDYFPDKMTIDYIKVNKLKCDCGNPATIPDTPSLTL
ncbi:MAG: family 16 glycosylhydrolase, partial [Bacteroidales bacterium]|nr:family 16 glycosylhydrolase [Bacteroidales bacterium]